MLSTLLQDPAIVYGRCTFLGRQWHRLMVELSDGNFRIGNHTGVTLQPFELHQTSPGAIERTEPVSNNLADQGGVENGILHSANFRLLTAHQQLSLLQKRYSRPFVQPLLPPYTWLQVTAIEAEQKIKFPPILRLYMQHISRQHAMTGIRSCFLTDYGDDSLDLEPDSRSARFGTKKEDLDKLMLRGPMQGFVWSNNSGYSGWIFGSSERYCWQTVFERLMRPIFYDCGSDASIDSLSGGNEASVYA